MQRKQLTAKDMLDFIAMQYVAIDTDSHDRDDYVNYEALVEECQKFTNLSSYEYFRDYEALFDELNKKYKTFRIVGSQINHLFKMKKICNITPKILAKEDFSNPVVFEVTDTVETLEELKNKITIN